MDRHLVHCIRSAWPSFVSFWFSRVIAACADPVIKIAIEPKSKGDLEKMGTGLYKLAQEDPRCTPLASWPVIPTSPSYRCSCIQCIKVPVVSSELDCLTMMLAQVYETLGFVDSTSTASRI